MRQRDDRRAPGQPGIEPRWTSSVKSGVGTAVNARSRVWFTLSHGILNEIYYPRVDQANTRDFGFIVTDGASYFSEEKRDTTSRVRMIAPGVPGFQVTNNSRDGRYRIVKTIVTDPERHVVLQDVRFEALQGRAEDYRLFALLAPHLNNQGASNTGWVGDYKGIPMLFARHDSAALALACSVEFTAASCGYVGVSDGWQQLRADKRLAECYTEAPDGNIALTGEIDLAKCGGRLVLALGFGPRPCDAGQDARSSLLTNFTAVCDHFVEEWNRYHQASRVVHSSSAAANDEYRLSVAVLKTHEDKSHPGAIIASLSIPWGNTKGDHDLGGYHVVWPRDLVQSAGALVAAGHAEAARHALHYLMVTQEADGHWPQNMWLDGRRYWSGNQLDETALPILLADMLRRGAALGEVDPWPMVRFAAAYLARTGPVTLEDRWEEDGGYSTFTLAVEVAALLAAADFAEAEGEPSLAKYFRQTADIWNDSIERWTYVTGTAFAREAKVDGYYARIAPPSVGDGDPSEPELIAIRNHPAGTPDVAYADIVSPDALALVRMGLRAPDDKRIVDTVRVIDRVLRTETRTGPVWHRYNDDGYGEHEDGSAFDGTGVGRGWPLLAGERAHYELAAGNTEIAWHLLATMRKQASAGGLIPEQVWDVADLPDRELLNGCPSGSAMPLVWAHAEFVKLARSLDDGDVFDRPPQAVHRYITAPIACALASWRFNNKIRSFEPGRTLRVETHAPAVVHWSADDWKTTNDLRAADTGIGVWYADLPTASLREGATVRFTFHWPDVNRWEGTDFSVSVGAPR